MNNFEYYNPVHIVFGKGQIAQLSQLIKPGQKIMLAYGGGSIKTNGVYDQVLAALKGYKVIEFSGIEANPQYQTCLKAAKLANDEGVDFILAVGGGSVIDGVKFIAAAARFDGDDPWDILRTSGSTLKEAIPFGTILTLPATGSEMNFNSVISRRETQEKLYFGHRCVYPVFSILDPETTYSLPANQLRNGIVDTFVHVMEQYATHDVNTPLQDRQAEAIIKTLIEQADNIMIKKEDYDSRANFLWCATQALNGLIGLGTVGDWLTHGIGHEMTAFFGLAHAETLAVIMPGVWTHFFQEKKGKLAQLARRTWHATGDIDTQAQAAIDNTVKFFHSISMPTRLSDYNLSQDAIDTIVNRFQERKKQLVAENSRALNQKWLDRYWIYADNYYSNVISAYFDDFFRSS
ncbi:MAG: iron-containing alcohol dehydrogenase [Phycisphaerae bacterium]|nr:iron-containing alcohol dehydrogenase [Phycisphaerae bacterium]